ncbi:MAG: glycosyltransferase family 2 protein [Candidatus Marinimicrobia bacterium]|nr:glycosyltransferase family 2 protein [Candidatus Neomarinimicrobiota bacterium]MBL7047049.1 glycosyltransferase family 2 protein [Candidatus Neomarinimicrobiota bacterium]
MNKKDISIVIPIFNEKESLPELLNEVVQILEEQFNYEIICVDDGSTDGSEEILRQYASNNPRIMVTRFLRNYGKSSALTEGFKLARGKYVITMDADLQDDPNEIPNLISKIEEGFDLVSGWKKKRLDPLSKRLPSKFFNFTTRLLTGIKIHDFNCGLKAYRNEVVKSMKIQGGMHRYVPVLVGKIGFKVTEMEVNHRPRKYGETKYGGARYFHGLFDLLTVLFLSRYMRRPLHLFGIFGILSFLIGFIVNCWVLYLKYGLGEPFSKHLALLVFGVMLLILGVQFISLGLLGEMIARSQPPSEEQMKQVIRETKQST